MRDPVTGTAREPQAELVDAAVTILPGQEAGGAAAAAGGASALRTIASSQTRRMMALPG